MKITFELEPDERATLGMLLKEAAKDEDKNNHTIDDVRYALSNECQKWREEKKKPASDLDNPTPQEKYDRMVGSITGGREPGIKLLP